MARVEAVRLGLPEYGARPYNAAGRRECVVLASVGFGGWCGALMVILALDVGQARIGIATCDDAELLATPQSVIRRSSTSAALDGVVRAIAESSASLVVIGLPISFDGQLHAQARSVQAFGEKLRHRVHVPIEYADETLSTWRAEELLRASGVRPERIRERIDAAAAAVILQDFLDQRHRQQQASDEPEHDATDTAETMYGEGGA